MKKTIGWILLVLGILAFFGGLISKVHSDQSVEMVGYILKIAMVIGGIILISSSSENKDSEETKSKTIINPVASTKIEIANNRESYKKIINRKPTFRVSEVEGFYSLPEEVIKMNKIEYHRELLKKLESDPVNPQFTRTIRDFIIPDNISFSKYYFNDTFCKNNYPPENEKFVSPTLKYFTKNPISKSLLYPSWFYCIYPDVAKWYIFGEGNTIIKKDFKEKLAYLNNNSESEILKEFLNTEFYRKSAEDESLKIKPETLRELIDIYKKLNPTLMLECECD